MSKPVSVIVIAEGQTEMNFVKTILSPYLGEKDRDSERHLSRDLQGDSSSRQQGFVSLSIKRAFRALHIGARV